MRKLSFIFSTLVLASLTSGCAGNVSAQTNEIPLTNTREKVEPVNTSQIVSKGPPESCPVTVPGILSFEPPTSAHLNSPLLGQFWFGSEHLWTSLPADGIWAELPKGKDGYSQKIFWWSDLFSLMDELEPALIVTGQRLDADAPPLKFYGATNAMADDIGEAMLTGVDFPTTGCWKVTGRYKKTELSFVVWIAP